LVAGARAVVRVAGRARLAPGTALAVFWWPLGHGRASTQRSAVDGPALDGGWSVCRRVHERAAFMPVLGVLGADIDGSSGANGVRRRSEERRVGEESGS